MYAKYGSYQHATNEVGLRRIEKNAGKASGGQVTTEVRQWTFGGFLQAATPLALTSAIQAMERAYAVHGLDWGMYEDNGTPSAHVLLSASAFGGVQVVSGPNWLDGQGEYTTFRSYEITVKAEYQVGGGVNFSQWRESISFEGDGGPIYRFIPTINGPWQKQMVNERSTYRAYQQGSIVGIFSAPDFPGPAFPDAEHREQRRVSRDGPTFDGTKYSNFGVNYSFVFESNSPLAGTPNRQPG